MQTAREARDEYAESAAENHRDVQREREREGEIEREKTKVGS